MVKPKAIGCIGRYNCHECKSTLQYTPFRLWEVATGENIATFWGHPTDVQDLAFSPDGTLLASGSFDGTILLWDVKSVMGS